MSQPGITEIGKYRIVEQVGEGAMGVVYRATDPVLNRTVAVKVMCDAVARDDDLRGRFLREAQAAGSLQHPNVITIYDFGEVDGHLFIAMEFVEGQDLEDLETRNIALPLVDKLDIVIDVLSGLAFAHKRGIVHRDIKPANIRIDDEGRARVMDFGIAHLSASSMTRTGIMVGTPAYMAPEQIVGTPVSPATDLFSVGTVLYELLSGSKPFQAESIQSIMYQIVSQPAPPLNARSSEFRRPSSRSSTGRWRRMPRPLSSAIEMANALTAVRAGLDRDASGSKTCRCDRPSTWASPPNAPRNNERPAVAAPSSAVSAAAAIVLASLGVFVLRNKPSPAPQTRAQVSPRLTRAETPSKSAPTNLAASNAAAPTARQRDGSDADAAGCSQKRRDARPRQKARGRRKSCWFARCKGQRSRVAAGQWKPVQPPTSFARRRPQSRG